jgi:hypothetical protein
MNRGIYRGCLLPEDSGNLLQIAMNLREQNTDDTQNDTVN